MKYYETKKKLKEYDPLFRAYDHQKVDLRASYEEGQEMREKRGLKLGEVRGLEQGRLETTITLVQNMITNDYTTEEIEVITGLTPKQIDKYKNIGYIIKQSKPLLVEESGK